MTENIINKEKKRVKKINSGMDHRSIGLKWLNIKRILDALYKLISPLGNNQHEIKINPNKFESNLFISVLDDLYNANITDYPDCGKGSIIQTSDSIREYYSGVIILKDKKLFEDYRARVSDLCHFIEKDGKSRFPGFYDLENFKIAEINSHQAEKLYNDLENFKIAEINSHQVKNLHNESDLFLVLYIRNTKNYNDTDKQKFNDYLLTEEIDMKTMGNSHRAIINSSLFFRIRNEGKRIALNVKLESENFIGIKYESKQIVASGDEQSVKVVCKPNNKIRKLTDLNGEVFTISCLSKKGNKFKFYWKIKDIKNGDIELLTKDSTITKGIETKNYNGKKKKIGDMAMYTYTREGYPNRTGDNASPVLGVNDMAFDISKIINGMKGNKGAIFGVFGRWGRGKSYLIERIKKQPLINTNFKIVDFSVWKYQDTPASWAYLYEALAKEYYQSNNFLKNIYLIIKLNFCRRSFINVFYLILLISGSLFISYCLSKIPLNAKISFFWYFISSFGIFSSLVIIRVYLKFKKPVIKLFKKYTEKKDFINILGLQHEIQKEIEYLLKSWLNKSECILLVVDDVDRCSEDKVIQTVDALRIMLDDKYISKKIVVLLAIDDGLLKRAVKCKYSKLFNETDKEELDKLTREYLDKLFLCGIRLGNLSGKEKEEVLYNIIKKAKYDEVIENSNNNLKKELNQEKSQNETNHTEGKGTDNDKTLSVINNDELEDDEINFLSEALKDIEEITPRQIDIYHFRYILARDILLSRSGSSSSYDPKILAKRIAKYTTQPFKNFESEVLKNKEKKVGAEKNMDKALEMVIIY